MSHEGIQPEARPGGTAIQGPVLEVPMALSQAIDVTPTPHASDAFLGDSSVNRSLPLWRKAAIAGTAFVAGVTAAGVAPKPAEANGFLLSGGAASSECIDDGGVYVLKREPGIAVGNTEAQLASVGQPQTGETATADQELLQGIEIALLPDGSRLIAVIAEACKDTLAPDSIQVILASEFKNFTKQDFHDMLVEAAPALANYFKGLGIKDFDTAKEVVKEHEKGFSLYLKNKRTSAGMSGFVGTIAAQVKKAQEAHAAGNDEAMTAFMNVALAYTYAAKTFLTFESDDPAKQDAELDAKIQKWATEIGIMA